jgi:hypothetical protein
MAEGLRNAGSTFARMTAKVFKEDTRFFTEVHLLLGKLLLVVAMHPLVGS